MAIAFRFATSHVTLEEKALGDEWPQEIPRTAQLTPPVEPVGKQERLFQWKNLTLEVQFDPLPYVDLEAQTKLEDC